jgi:omega-amidase
MKCLSGCETSQAPQHHHEEDYMQQSIVIGICQMQVEDDKSLNLHKAEEMIRLATDKGANLVILPEVFHAPYETAGFRNYAETFPGPSTEMLSRAAARHSICLVGGSIIEMGTDGKLYNTSYVFGANGELLGKHRKVHLFDVDGVITFKESDVVTPGNELTIIDYQGFRFGVMICYDIRFPEWSRALALEGAQMLVVPGAFNMSSGPSFWELMMRTRAIDNQVYIAAASPARNLNSSYHAWGHSMIVDPWGKILVEADSGEEVVTAAYDPVYIEKVRREMPLLKHRRCDLYELTYDQTNK